MSKPESLEPDDEELLHEYAGLVPGTRAGRAEADAGRVARAVPWEPSSINSESPNGARFLDAESVTLLQMSLAPLGLCRSLGMRQPRAKTPWAVESRPLGADERRRRPNIVEQNRTPSLSPFFRRIPRLLSTSRSTPHYERITSWASA